MTLAQYIYSTTCSDLVTAEKAVLISAKSIEVCQRLGLTGRVFSTQTHALAVTEGPSDIVERYYQAIASDNLVATALLHTKRQVIAREFEDYSVWLDIGEPFGPHPHVHQMTPQSLTKAMPPRPSARLRIMVDALFDDGRLVA